MDYRQFCSIVRSLGAVGNFPQCRTLAVYAQNKLPLQLTNQYLSPGQLVLDWGAGNGHYSLFLSRFGAQTTGYSFESPPAILTKEKNYSHILADYASPKLLPFNSNRFEAVCSYGVIEHVHETGGEQAASMREIHRILKPGGLFLCFHLPNRFSWIEMAVEIVNTFMRDKKHVHSRKFTRKDFVSLFSPDEFEIVREGRYNFLPRNILHSVPSFISNSLPFVEVLNFVDDIGSRLLPYICQNWFFILRKKASSP